MKQYPDATLSLSRIDHAIEVMRDRLKTLQPDRKDGSVWLIINRDDRPSTYAPGHFSYQWVHWQPRRSRKHKDLFYVAVRTTQPLRLGAARANAQVKQTITLINHLIKMRRSLTQKLSIVVRECQRIDMELGVDTTR